MKFCTLFVITVVFSSTQVTQAQDRYWVRSPTNLNEYNTAGELAEWNLVEDNGSGSWALSGSNSAILTMDDAAGAYANRLFNVKGGSNNLLPLDNVNGLVEIDVAAMTGGDQRFFLQVQEFDANSVYVTQQTLIASTNVVGFYSISLTSYTWNAATKQIRFILGGENFSATQGTVEFNSFAYNHQNRNWSNAANWSATSDGVGGASVPGASNTVIFDGAGGSTGDCYIDGGPITLTGLTINGSYTNSLDLRSNNMTITGSVTLETGTLVNSTGGTPSLILNNASGNATFSGVALSIPITGSASGLFFNGSVFNNPVTLTKTGAGTDVSTGGNTFNAAVSLTINNASGTLRLANVSGDTFNGAATFTQSAGAMEPAYNGANTFLGNVTTNSSTAITFGGGAGTGTVTFAGSSAQAINKAGSASPIFARFIINKPSQALTLNTDVTIGQSGTLTSGIINTTSTNYLNFADGSTVSGANNSSYVNGPVSKTGDDGFTFPTGKSGVYRFIAMSSPKNTADVFTAEYYNAAQGFGGSKDPSFETLSACEYWTLTGSTIVGITVTLSWNSSDCPATYVTDPSFLRVAHWNGSTWEDYGNASMTGDASSGTITSSVTGTSFSPLAVASSSAVNPLPIELSKFWALNDESAVKLYWMTLSEINNDYFTVERSENGLDFEPLDEIKGAATTNSPQSYTYTDFIPYGGASYYRLKQTDFDGTSVYHTPITVQRKGRDAPFVVYPNPSSDGVINFRQKADIVVLNHLNQVIMQVKGVEYVDLSTLPGGMYIIRNQEGEHVRVVIR